LKSQNFELTEWNYTPLASPRSRTASVIQSFVQDVTETKDPYEILGFGYISLFNSMRFLSGIFFIMALLMMLCGIYNWRSSPNLLGLSVFQRLAITNMN
jgi:hypothetical protein